MPNAPTNLGETLDLPASDAAFAPTLVPPGVDGATLASTSARGPTRFPEVDGFAIIKELGRGGMGVVYQARQTNLNRTVALKMILAGSAAGADAIARFQAEAQAVAKLQHPNIVQIYEVGTHEGNPYFSLEFVDGGSLEQALAGTPLAPREAATLIETLARTMHYAHGQGIVHRDLKPANVLLSAESTMQSAERLKLSPQTSTLSTRTPKITDFGLAKQLEGGSGQTKSGAILGTPSYMAPEQASGKTLAVGPAADVYALGAMLYECLTGRPPFRAATQIDTLLQVVDAEPVPPRRLQQKTPVELETICLKCLEKDPKRRYTDAAALADDLRRYLDNKPIAARPAGALERMLKWAKRNPAIVGIICSYIGVTIAITIIREHSRGKLKAEKKLAEEQRQLAMTNQERADKERQRAEQHLQKAIAAIDQMVFRVVNEKMAQLPQMQAERQKMLEQAAEFYQGFLKEESNDPRIRREMGRALYQLAMLYQGLGEEAKSKEQAEKAIAIQEELLAADPANRQYQFDLALSHIPLGIIASSNLNLDAALKQFGEALKRMDQLAAAEPDNLEFQKWLVECCVFCGYFSMQSPAQSEQYFKRAVSHAEELLARHPEDISCHQLLGAAYTHYAYLLIIRQQLREAGPIIEKGFQEMTSAGEETLPFRNRFVLASNYAGQGYVQLAKRQPKIARIKFERAIAYFEEALAAQPKAFHLVIHTMRAYDALVPLIVNDPDDAAVTKTLQRAVVLYDRIYDNYPAFRPIIMQRDVARVVLQILEARRGNFRQAVAALPALYPAGETNSTHAYNLACVYAQALVGLRKDSKLSAEERRALEAEYVTQAIRWLEQAKKLKYFSNSGRVEEFKKDTDLDPLRGQSAYEKFVQDLPKIEK